MQDMTIKRGRRTLNIRTEGVSMSGNDVTRLLEAIVFAGPNGSGKSTITQMAKIGGGPSRGKRPPPPVRARTEKTLRAGAIVMPKPLLPHKHCQPSKDSRHHTSLQGRLPPHFPQHTLHRQGSHETVGQEKAENNPIDPIKGNARQLHT